MKLLTLILILGSLSCPLPAQSFEIDTGDLLLSILLFRNILVSGTRFEATMTVTIDENVLSVMNGDRPVIIYRKRYWYLEKLDDRRAFGTPLLREPGPNDSLESLRDRNVEPVIFKGV